VIRRVEKFWKKIAKPVNYALCKMVGEKMNLHFNNTVNVATFSEEVAGHIDSICFSTRTLIAGDLAFLHYLR
jgi:hypothetical protein